MKKLNLLGESELNQIKIKNIYYMKISYENIIFISAINKTDTACLNIYNNVIL